MPQLFNIVQEVLDYGEEPKTLSFYSTLWDFTRCKEIEYNENLVKYYRYRQRRTAEYNARALRFNRRYCQCFHSNLNEIISVLVRDGIRGADEIQSDIFEELQRAEYMYLQGTIVTSMDDVRISAKMNRIKSSIELIINNADTIILESDQPNHSTNATNTVRRFEE